MDNSSPIKSFSIYGLFGISDVHIPFDEPVKILIGENGLGKTQILNIFYYTLTGNFFRLSEFNFDKLVLKFAKGEEITLEKEKIDDLIKDFDDHPMIRDLISEIGFEQVDLFRKNIIKNKGNLRQLEAQIGHSKLLRKYPIQHLVRIFESLDGFNIKDSYLDDCKERILLAMSDFEILYFPTFRRVEEDLHNLGYDEDDRLNQEDTIIQFGMDDVTRKFKSIENKIDRLLKDGFSKISSEILSQLIEDEKVDEQNFLHNVDENDIEILLSRVGDRISEAKKQKIKDIFLDRNTQSRDNSLNFFLKKLLEIYSLQKEVDNSVKVFRDVCNNYLINKQVFYDESNINICIKLQTTGKELPLSNLSSGEKQIISMFAKIYLSEEKKRFCVLFDEPELSLSMEWQKLLLPNIINSNKCDFLLAVTHSPFIFDNELDCYAIGLNEYFEPSKSMAI